ncbi:MAG: hypothetical protein RJAPGHWK_002391, partial [Candidatus Fervidibacter sp.]
MGRQRKSQKTAKSARPRSGTSSPSQPKKLIIVESPAKARTVQQIVGSEFAIESTMGH